MYGTRQWTRTMGWARFLFRFPFTQVTRIQPNNSRQQ
jgi:hypothetical protein